jgi:hypothetical protein
MASKPRSIYPLAIDPELDATITEAAQKLGLPKSEVMRLALAIGLEDLRKIDFNLARLVSDAARPSAPHLSMVADDPGKASSHFTPAAGAPVKYTMGKQTRRKKDTG